MWMPAWPRSLCYSPATASPRWRTMPNSGINPQSTYRPNPLLLHFQDHLSVVRDGLDLPWTLLFDLWVSIQCTVLINTQTHTFKLPNTLLVVLTCPSAKWLYFPLCWRTFLGTLKQKYIPCEIRLNRLTHTLWRQVMVYEVSNRGSVLHLSTSGWRRAPSAWLPSPPLGLICDEQEVCGVISTRCWHRQSSLTGLPNDQWTLTLQRHDVPVMAASARRCRVMCRH